MIRNTWPKRGTPSSRFAANAGAAPNSANTTPTINAEMRLIRLALRQPTNLFNPSQVGVDRVRRMGTPLAVSVDLEWEDLGPEQSALSAAGAQLVSLDELQDSQVEDVVALLSEGTPITGDQMRRYPNLRIVSEFGTGYDAIDLDAAR